MAEYKGIDVSSHNRYIDWQKVKSSSIDFALLRCGYGGDTESQDDAWFFDNVKGCEENSIPWGAYLYSYATTLSEANSEVKHTLRLLKNLKPSYPVYIDMEDADGYKATYGVSDETCTAICESFCRQMELQGYYAGIYANKYWFEKILDYERIKHWDCWLAQWSDTPTYNKLFGIWQYTSSGKVNGISTKVDMNISYLNYPKLIKAKGLNKWISQKPDEPL